MAARRRDTSSAVAVEGLDDFRRDLKRFQDGIDGGTELGRLNRRLAEFIVGKAEDIGTRLGGVHGHVVRNNSLRALGAQRNAEIALGGSAKKHGPSFGAEFGSHYYGQFPAWRGNQHEGGDVGYMLYPALRDNIDEGMDRYWDDIEDLARRAFPKKIN
jgi:hypothetical protein